MAASKPPPNEPTERTPKGHEVRIPKRREFLSNLKKVAKIGKPGSTTGGSKKQ